MISVPFMPPNQTPPCASIASNRVVALVSLPLPTAMILVPFGLRPAVSWNLALEDHGLWSARIYGSGLFGLRVGIGHVIGDDLGLGHVVSNRRFVRALILNTLLIVLEVRTHYRFPR